MSGFKIALYLSGLNFPCKDACSSYLEVKYGEDKTKTGARLCCERPKELWFSEGEEVIVMLKTEQDLVTGWLGFQLYYKLYGPETTTELPIPSSKELLLTTPGTDATEEPTEPTEEPYTEETEAPEITTEATTTTRTRPTTEITTVTTE
uniref:Uncharacterized protein n=1 Tax=Acrobeloides nanus TaxID=290746 RepID=A0A914DCH0_9BILA